MLGRRIALLLIAISWLGAATSPLSSSSFRNNAMSALGRVRQDFSYFEYLTADIVDPFDDAAEYMDQTSHGPYVSAVPSVRTDKAESVEWNFSCYFGIADENGNYWNFTYEARLFDPFDNQLAYSTNWAFKPAYSSNLGRNLVDPAAGTYRCTVDWWVEDFYLGSRQATVQLSWTAPSGETTESSGWWTQNTSVHDWTQTLTGGDFSGRRVAERDPGGGGPDYCHFSGSIYNPFTHVTNPPDFWWDVTNNRWGVDHVGWVTGAVEYYRNTGRAPCDTSFPQDMVINCPGCTEMKYVTNTLRAGITNTTVWSERAGQYAERIWP